ncbi:MAG: FAD-dependent oxidoreductase [Oscillospiraceae bacterium]|nr:FAD-dependent oxidoreductase [Oscillospiraceae bacterium]
MSEIKLTINGIACAGQQGETILDVAKRHGIDIPTLCHDDSVAHYGACGVCVVEAENSPKLLRACSTLAADGMVIHTEGARAVQARKIALELLMSDHDGDCMGPCRLACPAGTDCQAYVKQVALGNTKEAVRIVKERLPLPACIGHVCPHPCETDCRRGLVEEPISIAMIKRYMSMDMLDKADKWRPERAPATGKRVGVIGGGPAGLTAAYYLALKGHDVTVSDFMPQMGGMLRYGIPEYRLPKAVVDAEVAEIAEAGVKLENNVAIGRDISFNNYVANFDAVVVAIGAWKSSPLGCAGEDNFEGVYGGIDFLRGVALGIPAAIGSRVAVVGGGNTAMDACRTAVRLGAEKVYIIYRRTQNEMPANSEEIEEAMEEGVEFKFLTNPAEILGENGHVTAVKLQVMELGEPDASGRRSPVPVEGKFETLEVDSVIAAIGQKVDAGGFEALELNRRGIIAAEESTFRTNIENVFAVGDATNRGADIAIAAIGEASKCADVVDSYLHGAVIPYRKPFVSKRSVTAENFKDREKLPRVRHANRPAEERKRDFLPVNAGFTTEEAMKEAARCLECGCHDYRDCALIRHANRYEIHPERFAGEKRLHDNEKKLVVIERDQGKCILCNLCVRVCDEVAKEGLLGLVGRGFGTVIKPEFRDSERVKVCATCKKCAEACPTGALKIIG